MHRSAVATPFQLVRSRLFLPVFALLLLVTLTPVMTADVPPLADYVNHLARMHVIATIDQDPYLQQFYDIRWVVLPNLMMDLIVPALHRLLDIYLAGQLFVAATILLLVTGPMAIHRALYGRGSPWPLVAFLFVFNGIFLFAFMNYLFGLGVALWGVAGWIALRDRGTAGRLILSTAVVLITFTCHLFAVGLYGLGLLGWEIWRAAEDRPSPATLVRRAVAMALPFTPVLPLMLASPTMGLSGDILWESTGKIEGLWLIVQTYSDFADVAALALMVAGGVWAMRRNLLSMHPAGWVLLTLGILVYMAMPRMLFGSWLADQRLPVGLVFLLVGFGHFDSTDRRNRYALFAFITGLALLRTVDIQVHWQHLRQINLDFLATVDLVEPGSTILVAHADTPAGIGPEQAAISHAPCIALIKRSSLVSTVFTVPGKQVLSVRPAFRDRVDTQDGNPPTVSQMIAATDDSAIPGQPRFWDHWPDHYDYVFLLYTEGDPNPDPDHLALIHEGHRFQLYRVTPATAVE